MLYAKTSILPSHNISTEPYLKKKHFEDHDNCIFGRVLKQWQRLRPRLRPQSHGIKLIYKNHRRQPSNKSHLCKSQTNQPIFSQKKEILSRITLTFLFTKLKQSEGHKPLNPSRKLCGKGPGFSKQSNLELFMQKFHIDYCFYYNRY